MTTVDLDSGRRPAGDTRALDSSRIEAQVRRERTVARRKVVAWRIALGLGMLGLWEFVSGAFIDPFWISTPTDVAQQVYAWMIDGTIPRNLYVTLQEMIVGLVLGYGAAVLTGVLAGLVESVAKVLDPYIAAAYNTPHLAFVPLLVLIFGIGITSKIALVFFAVYFVVFYNVVAGMRDVDSDLIDTVKCMGAGRWAIFVKVLVPSMTAWLFIGLRLAIRNAFIGAVVGEMIAATEGIGWLVQDSAGRFNSTGVYAGLTFLVIIAVLLNGLLSFAESRYVHRR